MTDQQTCSNCGGTLPAGAIFCTQCGTRFEAPTAAAGSPGAPPAPAPGGLTPPPMPAPPAAPPQSSPVPGVPDQAPAPPPVPSTPPPAPRPTGGEDATRIVTPQADPTRTLPTAPPSPAYSPPPSPAYSPPPAAPAPPGTTATPPPPVPPAPGVTPPPVAAPPGMAYAPPAGYAPPAAGPGQATAPVAAVPYAAPAPAPAGGKAKVKSPVAALLAILGGALLIGAAFLPWMRVHDSVGNITAISGPKASNDAYTVLGIGAAAIVFSVLLFAGSLRGLLRLLYFAGFVAAAAVLAFDFYDIHNRLPKKADIVASGITQIDIGLGIFVGFGAAVLLLLACITIRRKPKVAPTGFTPPMS